METKLKIWLVVFVLVWSSSAISQEKSLFTSSKDLMPVGAYYDPEHWNRDQLGCDLKRMVALGFSFKDMAEFACANLAQEEGKLKALVS